MVKLIGNSKIVCCCCGFMSFLCRLQSIVVQWDHFVCLSVCVCLFVCLSWLSHIAMFRRQHVHSSECCHYVQWYFSYIVTGYSPSVFDPLSETLINGSFGFLACWVYSNLSTMMPKCIINLHIIYIHVYEILNIWNIYQVLVKILQYWEALGFLIIDL